MLHDAGVCGVAVTGDGRRVVSSDMDGKVSIWDLSTHALVEGWKHTHDYPHIALSPDDQLVAYGSWGVVVQELNSGRIKYKIETDASSLCFSPDGSKLACGSQWSDICIYDSDTGRLISTLKVKPPWHGPVRSLQWSHANGGTRLFSVSFDKTVCCWNTETGEQIGEPWRGHTGWIHSLSLSPDGTKIASASRDTTVRFWDTSGHPIGYPLRHEDEVCAVRISPSNDLVATAGCDRKVYLWRVPWGNDITSQSTRVFDTAHLLEAPTLNPADVNDISFLDSAQAAPHHAESTPVSPLLSRKDGLYIFSYPVPQDLTHKIVMIDDRRRETGGFSDVHCCVYNSPSGIRLVAVKVFRFPFMIEKDSRSRKMIHRELGIWRRLDHPNIVPFLGITDGFGIDDSKSIVSLWMPNGNLHKFISSHNQRLDVVHRLQMLLDVAQGLEYLHSFPDNPIVHGDLNGNNVLLDTDFTACLTDFGYSSFIGNLPEGLEYLHMTTARPGATRWIAPEQLDDGYERIPKSDIYSFGCICLQVLSGKKPWPEVREDAGVIVRLVKGQKPSRPASTPINDRHWAFIERCWSTMEDRPVAKMLISSLQQFLSEFPSPLSLRDLFASSSTHQSIPVASGTSALSPVPFLN